MKINIFPLIKTHMGYIPSDTLLAVVIIKEGENNIEIECFDGAFKEKIQSIFTTPIYKRCSDGDGEKIFSFYHKQISPEDKDFIKEILLMLRVYNLYGEEISENS